MRKVNASLILATSHVLTRYGFAFARIRHSPYADSKQKNRERTQAFFRDFPFTICTWLKANAYIIPPIPPPAGIAGASSLMFATTDSVVRSVEATLVAF